MRTKSLILGFCATAVAATGAIAAFASKTLQTSYYVKRGDAVLNITGKFAGCSGTGNICRVKLISPTGVVLTEATTVYINDAATFTTPSSFAVTATVVIP